MPIAGMRQMQRPQQYAWSKNAEQLPVLDASHSMDLGEPVGTDTLRAAIAPVLVIACGALSHEIQYLKTLNGWSHVKVQCLDAKLHNRPQLIPGRLREAIHKYRDQYDNIFVAYADCGTGGAIDSLLREEGIERLPGAHCYSFYAGEQVFSELAEEQPGTFFLTDFLARHFDRLIIKGLKLDLYPELLEDFFGNYERVVYLSQRNEKGLLDSARDAAAFLGLEFEHLHCGYGDLATGLEEQVLAFAEEG